MNYDKMYDCVYVCSMRFQWQMQQKPEIAACNDIQLSYGSIESVCLVDRFFSLLEKKCMFSRFEQTH